MSSVRTIVKSIDRWWIGACSLFPTGQGRNTISRESPFPIEFGNEDKTPFLIRGSNYMRQNLKNIPWSEIESQSCDMFGIFSREDETNWLKESWAHLEDAGLTADGTVLEQTKTLLRLVALAWFYKEFQALLADDSIERIYTDLADCLEINPVTLGVIASSFDPGCLKTCRDDGCVMECALHACVQGFREEIFGCLAKASGGSYQIYLKMYACVNENSRPGHSSPFSSSGENTKAYFYVKQGFSL